MTPDDDIRAQIGAVAALLAHAGEPLGIHDLRPAFPGLGDYAVRNRLGLFVRRGWLAPAPRRLGDPTRRYAIGTVDNWKGDGPLSPRPANHASLEAAVRMVAFALSVPKSSPKLTTTDDFDHALVAIGGAWDAAVHELEVALDVDDRLAGIRERLAEVAA